MLVVVAQRLSASVLVCLVFDRSMFRLACEQPHFFGSREPGMMGFSSMMGMMGKRARRMRRPILLVSSRLQLPIQTSEPARRLCFVPVCVVCFCDRLGLGLGIFG